MSTCWSCSVSNDANDFDAIYVEKEKSIATVPCAVAVVSPKKALKALKAKAILFGLNYKHCINGQLNGCINDVNDCKDFLTNINIDCKTFTDDTDRLNTSGRGIVQNIYKLALASWKENLDLAWIHYSGHGGFVKDASNDEDDGMDECLVPSDYETRGVILDDEINDVLSHFNPKTRVILVFDCCHSGTIADMMYSYSGGMMKKNKKASVKGPMGPVIALSGCLDDQTAADAWNPAKAKYQGALTASLLKVLREKPNTFKDVFVLLSEVRALLRAEKYAQVPLLTASFDMTYLPEFLPAIYF